MNALPVARTAAAEQDLINIWMVIAEHNPFAADKVLDRLEVRWSILRDYPQAGVNRDDISVGIRMLVEGNYLILHRVNSANVEIVRIVHTRQRLTSDVL